MDSKSNVKKETDGAPPPRKGGLKFKPKKPPKKAAKVVPKTEPIEESKDDIIDRELLMKLKTSQSADPFGRRVKTEKKEIHAEIAFGQGSSSNSRSFPVRSHSAAPKVQKEYADPWDYTNSDYPVTLPLRRPHSGNPEILDEEEFGESAANRAEDDGLTEAEALGLKDPPDTPQLLFFQLPSPLPFPRQPQSVIVPNTGSNKNAEPGSTNSNVTHAEAESGGLMGKMLVYKSGKVKLKMGNALFDVSSGINCMFAQEAAAINTREKHCCTVGEVRKFAVVTPEDDCLLNPS